MKVFIIGANGFMGRHLVEYFEKAKYQVFRVSRRPTDGTNEIFVDLLDPKTIHKALKRTKPDFIINCGGIIGSREEVKQNPTMTLNLLNEITLSGIKLRRIIILGSAAEYGAVPTGSIPVKETTALKPTSLYGESKKEEVEKAIEYAENHNLPLVVARIFNPIGTGMNPNQLIPGIINQAKKLDDLGSGSITISRLDSLRDYININDVARAIERLCKDNPKYTIYNIGSGKSTSNEEIVLATLSFMGITKKPSIVETSSEKEHHVASKADITRIKNEFGWAPHFTVKDTIKGIINAK
jgi:GDP-4-dehydro-6-deoxy-D-mannose reductase